MAESARKLLAFDSTLLGRIVLFPEWLPNKDLANQCATIVGTYINSDHLPAVVLEFKDGQVRTWAISDQYGGTFTLLPKKETEEAKHGS